MYGPYLESMSSLPVLIQIDWGAVLSHAIAAMVGSFFGAVFAFSLSLWQKRKEEKRRDLAAGNLALATLAEQLGSFLDVRKQAQASLAEEREVHPSAPLWFLMLPPKHYPFRKEVRFDFPALAFIFESEDPGVFTKLVTAQRRYEGLAQLFEMYEETGEAAQEKMEGSGLDFMSKIHIGDLETVVGPKLVAKLTSIGEAILIHFDKDEGEYKAAEDALRLELVRVFREKRVVKIERKPGF